ncbi:MAG: hypothetical protein HQ592_18760 [Planctomycetes bacterium]|nr:hypothetical protein [Planctomycetota bacterium]
MAKLSGPEEFFEVFSDKQAGRPPADRLSDDHPVEARIAPAPRDKTVTIQVRTLVIGCMSAALLIALSYFVGLSNRPEAQPPGPLAGRPAGGSVTNGPADPADLVGSPDDSADGNAAAQSDGEAANAAGAVQQPQREGYILLVATYDNTAVNVQYAKEVVSYLKQQKELRLSPVSIGTLVTGRHLVVCIGPFPSTKSETARRIHEAVKGMSYKGRPFNDAYFIKMPQSP